MQNSTTDKTFYVYDFDREVYGVVTFDPRYTTPEAVAEAMVKLGPEVRVGEEVPPTDSLGGIAEEVFEGATREGIPFSYRVNREVHARIAAGRIRRLALTAWSREVEINGDLVAQLSRHIETLGNYWGYLSGQSPWVPASPYGTRTNPGDAEYDETLRARHMAFELRPLADIDEHLSLQEFDRAVSIMCRVRGLISA